jgi:hypothetical protein
LLSFCIGDPNRLDLIIPSEKLDRAVDMMLAS